MCPGHQTETLQASGLRQELGRLAEVGDVGDTELQPLQSRQQNSWEEGQRASLFTLKQDFVQLR